MIGVCMKEVKKLISLRTKLRHYNIVIKPGGLYAVETLNVTAENYWTNWKRNILGESPERNIYALYIKVKRRLRLNNETPSYTRNTSNCIDEKQMSAMFFSHFLRVNQEMLT